MLHPVLVYSSSKHSQSENGVRDITLVVLFILKLGRNTVHVFVSNLLCGLTQENDEDNFEGNEGQGDDLEDDDDDDSDDDGTLQGKCFGRKVYLVEWLWTQEHTCRPRPHEAGEI